MPPRRSTPSTKLGSSPRWKDLDIERIREEALDAIPQSLVIASASDPDHPIIYANRGFEVLTGYTVDEALGRNCRFLAGPETSAQTRAEIRDALGSGTPFACRILNYRKDGGAFWNDLTLTPLRDSRGNAFVVGVQIDVTERIELESRLREAQRMEALGKLSGGIAHDFNNVLALILGNAEIIAGEVGNGSMAAEAASDIIEAAEGGSNLVQRLLQYARGENGEVEEISVNQVIGDVIALVSRSTSEPVKFETDLSAAVGRIKVDKALFSTALINLLLNARDAITGTGAVRVGTRRRANASPTLGTAAVITIEDSGVGMEPDVAARAFEPFFTTKAPGRGNGLGLPMVYNFVKQSYGDISIESAPGRGTVVTMLLPIDEPAVRSISEGTDATRILVVEDDTKVRKMIATQLSRSGYLVDEVASAEEALKVVEGGALPGLLLSDIRLREGLSGVDLVLELRRRGTGMPMVLMTGFAEELELQAEALSGVPVIRKPFRNAELLREIEHALPRRGRGGKRPRRGSP